MLISALTLPAVMGIFRILLYYQDVKIRFASQGDMGDGSMVSGRWGVVGSEWSKVQGPRSKVQGPGSRVQGPEPMVNCELQMMESGCMLTADGCFYRFSCSLTAVQTKNGPRDFSPGPDDYLTCVGRYRKIAIVLTLLTTH